MLEIGQTFDRYTIEALIGQGGMGTVFRARDTRLRRTVALKVLAGHFPPAARGLILREARIAASLNHPNIVAVFDVGEHEGVTYMAMELLAGLPLRHYVNAPPAMPQRLGWLLDIARGLDVAHRAGLVHRDVKPGNVIVTAAGAKILDFGIAKPGGDALFTAPMPAMKTSPGLFVGTPRYMAPEQIAGATVDPRADQFSWALTAYELISGVPARDNARDTPIAASLHEWSVPSLDAIPPRVAEILNRALARDPASRFASMADIAAALVPLSGQREATLEFLAFAPEQVAGPPPEQTLTAPRQGAPPPIVGPTAAPAPSTKPPSGTAPKSARFRTPDPTHFESLVTSALSDLGWELPAPFREARIVVTVDIQGQKGRYFVTIAAVNDQGRLCVIASSSDSLRAAGYLISADARSGNGRWTRIVIPLGPRGLDASTPIELT